MFSLDGSAKIQPWIKSIPPKLTNYDIPKLYYPIKIIQL